MCPIGDNDVDTHVDRAQDFRVCDACRLQDSTPSFLCELLDIRVVQVAMLSLWTFEYRTARTNLETE